MADTIHPQKIYGKNWKDGDGWVLDFHTDPEKFTGFTAYGYPQYERTYVGELIYKLKHNEKSSEADKNAAADAIVKLALTPKFRKWISDKNISLVIPTPFTKPRDIQPVFLLAEKFANALGIKHRNDLLIKISDGESKNQNKDNKDVVIEAKIKNESINSNVLLIDDVFESGATLDACIPILKDSYKINNVYVLCITRKRNIIIRV